MATVSRVSTENVIGRRQSLSDLLSNITPVDCPFTSAIKKGSVDSTFHEYQIESLEAAKENARIEGADAPAASMELTSMQSNRTQILSEVASVTGSVQAANLAGRKKELSHQIANKMKVLKRDLEYAAIRNTTAVASNDSTARKTRGLQGWMGDNVDLNTVDGGEAAIPDTNTAAVDATALRAFTESQLTSVLQACYETGGSPDTIMAAPANRSVFSTFTGVSSAQNVDVKSNTIVGSMSIYESDFGTLKVIPNRFQRNRDVFVLDMKDFELSYYRPLETISLATTGDSTSKQLIMEVMLKVSNYHKHGAILDLS